MTSTPADALAKCRRRLRRANGAEALIEIVEEYGPERTALARSALLDVASEPRAWPQLECCAALVRLGDGDRAKIVLFDVLRDHRTILEVRSTAMSMLIALGYESAAADVIRQLSYDRFAPSAARFGAAATLWRTGRRALAERVFWELLETDTEIGVQLEITQFLPSLSAEAAAALERIASDESLEDRLRGRALLQLRAEGDQALMRAARCVAGSHRAGSDLANQAAAILADRLAPDVIPDVVLSCGDTPAIAALVERLEDLQVLRALAADPNVTPAMRISAASKVLDGTSGDQDAVALVALLQDQPPWCRSSVGTDVTGQVTALRFEVIMALHMLARHGFSDHAVTLWSAVARATDVSPGDRLHAFWVLIDAGVHDVVQAAALEIANDPSRGAYYRLEAARYLELEGDTVSAIKTAQDLVSDPTQGASVLLDAARLLLRQADRSTAIALFLRVAQRAEHDNYERFEACTELEGLGEVTACRETARDIACDRSDWFSAGNAVEMLLRQEWIDELIDVGRHGAVNAAKAAARALKVLLEEEPLLQLARDDEVEGSARFIMIQRWTGVPETEVDLLVALAESFGATVLARSDVVRRLVEIGKEEIAARLLVQILGHDSGALWPSAMGLPRGEVRRRVLRAANRQNSLSPDVRFAILQALADDEDEDAAGDMVALAFDNSLDTRLRGNAAEWIPMLGYRPEAVEVLVLLLSSPPDSDAGGEDVARLASGFCRYATRHDLVRAAYHADLAPEVRLRAGLEMQSRGYALAVLDALIELSTLTHLPASVRLRAADAARRGLGVRALRRTLTWILGAADASEGVREAAAARLAVLS